MATLYTQESKNIRKTWYLMVIFFVLIIAVGFALSYIRGDASFLYGACFLSLFLNIGSYWFSDKLVLSMAGATPVENKSDYPELWNIVENLSIGAGLPMPRLYIIDDPAPNAFATGRDKNHAVIAVTTGILPLLNKSELEGVVAHELSHIGNRDMLVQTVVVVFAGMFSLIADMALRGAFFSPSDEKKNPIGFVFAIIGILLAPLAAMIIKLSISRKREFLADASGSLLTRYPEGLAQALQKIASFKQPMKRQNNAIAHLFISDPSGGLSLSEEGEQVSFLKKMFMTHPPVEERVAALLSRE